MKTPIVTFMAMFFLTCCIIQTAHAQIPSLVNYRGQLLDGSGQPITGTVSIELLVFASSSGGTALYTEAIGTVEVKDGQYAFQFGSAGTPDFAGVIQSNAETWVEVSVNNNALPRQRFVSVPYALNAGSANIAPDSITLDKLSQDVRNDLNRTITKAMLSQEVLDDLNHTIAPGTITQEMLDSDLNNTISNIEVIPSMLSDSILKYLRPEITQSPTLSNTNNRDQIYTGQSFSLSAGAEGKYLTYQWLRNGVTITGATSPELTITDTNESLHDGNYTMQATNDFGTVSSAGLIIDINTTTLVHQAELNSSVSMEMLWVEPGTFMMGQAGIEDPVHQVTLTKGFYLGKYEVTQDQYKAVMGTNPSDFNSSANGNHPVEDLNWTEANAFCEQLTTQERNAGRIPSDWAYVLPTESQWEYSCRSGTSTFYTWGDDINSSFANFKDSALEKTISVGGFTGNSWGFFDMHGNVNEWTADFYAAYSSSSKIDPKGPDSGENRVIRGGSWDSTSTNLVSANRLFAPPSTRTSSVGFRVAYCRSE